MDNTQNTGRRYIYFYFNRNEPEKIRQVVPAHVGYWKAANLKEPVPKRMTLYFMNRSGHRAKIV